MTAALRRWLVALIPIALVLPCAVLVPFWFDEIFTYQLAHTASWGQFWNALAHGPELNPPLSYLLARGSQAIFGGRFNSPVCRDARHARRRRPRPRAWYRS